MKLELWTRPNNYLGQTWEGYYVFLSQTRDSNALTRSNFECALKQIGGINDYAVVVTYERHWACGWLETILIHKTNTKALKIADDILWSLADYPVLDEDHFLELEYEENPEMYQE